MATAPLAVEVAEVAEAVEVAEVAEAADTLSIVTVSLEALDVLEALPVVTASLSPVVSEIPRYSKLYWGPRVWRLFHTLAEVSNRRDVLGMWHMVLAATADSMPCAQCRTHFSAYLRTHPVTFVKRGILLTGAQTRDKIRGELWKFHNVVNKSTGKEEASIDILLEQYGAKTRNELLLEAQRLVNEIKGLWEPLLYKQISPKALHEWKRALHTLLLVLRGGPN